MPKIYRKTCEYCGVYYESHSKRFCSSKCWHLAEKGLANHERVFSTPGVQEYNDYWQLHGDYVITSDWHIPHYDEYLTDKMLAMAKKFKIKKIIIVGDFLDQSAFRSMLYDIPNTFADIKQQDIEQVFLLTADIINKLLTWFTEIRLLTGNHDVYFMKILRGTIKLDRFWKMVGVPEKEFHKKVFASIYPFCALNDTWHVTHPATYSRIPMTVARSLSTKYRKSILSAHGHQWGLSSDISGRDICGDTGGLFNYKTMQYKWVNDTTHPQWVGGFWIIKNNKPYMFSDLATDWNFWLNNITIREGHR